MGNWECLNDYTQSYDYTLFQKINYNNVVNVTSFGYSVVYSMVNTIYSSGDNNFSFVFLFIYNCLLQRKPNIIIISCIENETMSS